MPPAKKINKKKCLIIMLCIGLGILLLIIVLKYTHNNKTVSSLKYTLIDSGTCDSNAGGTISTKSECETAAIDLNINEPTVMSASAEWVPSHCYNKSGEGLYFNVLKSNTECSSDRKCLCKARASAKTDTCFIVNGKACVPVPIIGDQCNTIENLIARVEKPETNGDQYITILAGKIAGAPVKVDQRLGPIINIGGDDHPYRISKTIECVNNKEGQPETDCRCLKITEFGVDSIIHPWSMIAKGKNDCFIGEGWTRPIRVKSTACVCIKGETWSHTGEQPCNACSSPPKTCPSKTEIGACIPNRDTGCVCIEGKTWSADGKTDCKDCSTPTCPPNKKKVLCTPKKNTDCEWLSNINIKSVSECEAAGAKFLKGGVTQAVVYSSKTYPPNCYYGSHDDLLYYNTNLTSKADCSSTHSCICTDKQGENPELTKFGFCCENEENCPDGANLDIAGWCDKITESKHRGELCYGSCGMKDCPSKAPDAALDCRPPEGSSPSPTPPPCVTRTRPPSDPCSGIGESRSAKICIIAPEPVPVPKCKLTGASCDPLDAKECCSNKCVCQNRRCICSP